MNLCACRLSLQHSSEDGRQASGRGTMDRMCGPVSAVTVSCRESACSVQRPAGGKVHSFQSHQADTDR